jgi:hypothetical protein
MGIRPVVVLLALAGSLGVAEARTPAGSSPFTTHLRDAIQLNRERASRYSALTGGASRKISRRMVFFERLTLPVAMLFDRCARKYQRAGVPLLSEDMVSMAKTPPFSDRLASPPPLERFVPADARGIARRIRRAYKEQRWSGVSRVAEEELGKLRGEGAHHSLLRHMLESVARISHLAPKHSSLALRKGMKPTDGFSWRLVQLHLLAFPSFSKLDRLAAPLQSRGVPIIHQDVPPISTMSAFYDR